MINCYFDNKGVRRSFEMKRVSCKRVVDDKYDIRCRIKKRGEKDYFWHPGDDYMTRDSKIMHILPEAKEMLQACVESYNADNEKNIAEGIHIIFDCCDTELYYRRVGKDSFAYTLNFKNRLGENVSINDEGCLRSMLFDANIWPDYSKGDKNTNKEIRKFGVWNFVDDSIENHLLYKSAVENGDELLRRQLKKYYNFDDAEDCEYLSRELGFKVYPRMPVEYNKKYYIDAKQIVVPGGYTVLHRPYFAMKGSTHSIWTINPHTRTVVDAAPVDAETTPFDEFMKILEEHS